MAKAKKKSKKLWVKSKKKDLEKKAKRVGKRVKKDGSVYYEYRMNRADRNPKKKLSQGGMLNKTVSLKDIITGKK